MKQVSLKAFIQSRKSPEGSVEVQAETKDGEKIQLNISPDVAEQLLWAIQSINQRTDISTWKTWPIQPDMVIRHLMSDGSMTLEFCRENRISVSVLLDSQMQQTTLHALDPRKNDQTRAQNPKGH